MPYCYNCGVKLDNSQNICPLCGAKIPETNLSSNKNINQKISSESQLNEKQVEKIENKNNKNEFLYPLYHDFSEKSKITSLIEIISVSLLISIVSLVLINLILESKISWSKIPSVTIFFIWIIFCSTLLFQKKILYILLFVFLSIFGYLLSLDSFDKTINWSINYAVPILVSCLIVFVILLVVNIRVKQKGLNLIAYYLLGGCLLCFAIDIIINFNILHYFYISWSKYVSFAVFPLSIFLLYIHHRFAKKLPGKRTFRI